MNARIRKEESRDFKSVFELIRDAFEKEEMSDHQEQYLVERLRSSDAFVPELSLVAEVDEKIVGYILLTKIKIIESEKVSEALALAPIAILPAYQGKGLGGQLIRYAHETASALGFGIVVLLGHENYYPKFGYEMAKKYGVKLPFEVPDENCMVIGLKENALQQVNGTVEYPKEFGL